jgi:hypothetical protein
MDGEWRRKNYNYNADWYLIQSILDEYNNGINGNMNYLAGEVVLYLRRLKNERTDC